MPPSTKLALGAFLYTLTTSFVSAAPQDLGLGGAIGSLILSQQLAGHASTTSPPAAPSSTSTTSSALLAPPSPTPSAQTNIQIGNTPQSVGDLTGTDLINKILAAVQPLCPDVNATTGKGACTGTTNGEISSVAHIASDETLGGGTLLFNVRDSGYETNDQRDGMIALFASTMNSSASGAANCASVRYRSDCGPAKREALLQGGPDVPNQDCTTGTKRICSGPDNVDIEIVEDDEAIATLNIDITFEWPGEAFSCSSVLDLIEAGLAFLPEIEIFSKAADVAVGLAKPCCESDGCGKTGGDRRKRMLMD